MGAEVPVAGVGGQRLGQPRLIAMGVLDGGRDELLQRRVEPGVGTDRTVGEHVVAVGRVAEQHRPAGPGDHHRGARCRWCRCRRRSPGRRGREHPPAEVAAAERGQYRLVGGQDELDQVAVESALRAVSAAAAMASSLSPSSSATSVTCTADPLAAASSRTPNSADERGQLGVELAQPVLVGLVEGGAGPDEVEVVALQELGRLGIETQLVAARRTARRSARRARDPG